MKVNYCERFNLVLLEVWWLSRLRYLQYQVLNQCMPNFLRGQKGFINKGGSEVGFCLPETSGELSLVSSASNPIEACYCGTQRPSYDRKKA